MCSTAGWHPRWAVGDTEAASVLRMEESRDRVGTADIQGGYPSGFLPCP